MAHGASLKSLAKDERPVSTWQVVRRMLGYFAPFKWTVGWAIAWLAATSMATAAGPALTGRLVDAAVQSASTNKSLATLALPAALLVLASMFAWFAQRQQILLLGTAGQNALYDLRGQVFSKLQRMPVAFYETTESGDLMSRLINDIQQVNSFLSQGFRRLLGSLFGLIATLLAMLWVDPRLAAVTLLVVPVMYLVSRLFGFVARRAFRRRQETISDVSSTLAEELAGIKVAQAFNRTSRNREQFSLRNAENRDANIGAATVSSAFSPVLSVISAAATALVAAFGGYMAAKGTVSIGVVVAFFGYARQFFSTVTQLSSLYADTQAALAGGERVFQLLDAPITVADSPEARDVGRLRGRIEYQHVYFRYASGPEVLHDVSLRIEAGTTLAVVGRTGAGKTTLINLVPRFYDPVDGRVLVDGIDVRAVTMESLRGNLGIVLQEPFLFAGTVAENIRYGRLEASDDAVRSAAAVARALDFIELLPNGFDTQVGERGSTLSTGQRQLIAFARAVLADPAILILDEATSSVDTRTEVLIQEGLRTILAGRTALIIAHRLSTVRDADRIVVVDDGRIVEDGSYAELLAASGPFAQLHAAQFEE
jgi:ATP-binding cassette, subfamily B, multidrug efflux pump